MSPIARLAAPVALVMLTGAVQAADFDPVTYHQANCTRCHGTEVYTRADRRVRSYPMLEAQVARCDANLATKLFPDDLELLVEHLNNSYYQFAK